MALEDAQAKGFNRLRSEFQSHEDKLVNLVINDLDDEKEQSEKIAAVRKQAAGLANKAAKLLKTSNANKRQRPIQSARVDELQCEMSRIVAEHEVVRQEVDTQQRAKQSMVSSEIAQAQKQFKADIDQFEAKMAEHKRQIQDLTSPSSSWEQFGSSSNWDTDFDAATRSRLTRRVGTAQNELL